MVKLTDFTLIDNTRLSGSHGAQEARFNKNGHQAIYKPNKYNHPELSQLEAAFSALAKLFLIPQGTPNYQLVTGFGYPQVKGVIVEDLQYIIAEKEKSTANANFYQIVEHPYEFELKANELGKIPYYFLDNFSKDFFCRLRESPQITLDRKSLASVLATSYFLEEDDLHKGNIAFYIIKENDQVIVKFIKIDHDLMLTNSILSYQSTRMFNLTHGFHSYDIDKNDLLNFPKVTKARPYFWPGTANYLARPSDNKNYSFPEINAFASLAEDKLFKQEVWLSWYKHIMIPPEIVTEQLKYVLKDETFELSTQQENTIALITNAVVARQAQLKAVLLSIPEFRAFILKESQTEANFLEELIISTAHLTDENLKRTFTEKNLQRMLTDFKDKIKTIEEGDTPLHIAIRLGEYRYHETWDCFKQFKSIKNCSKNTPLELAYKLSTAKKDVELPEQGSSRQTADNIKDPRTDYKAVAKDLLTRGATHRLRKPSKLAIKQYSRIDSYITKVSEISDSTHFFEILGALGADNRYCLKMKKEISIQCLKIFLRNPTINQKTVKNLKSNLNNIRAAHHSKVKFISQLRSRLWIIRYIRGLYGNSTTKATWNNLLDKKSKELTSSSLRLFAQNIQEESSSSGLSPMRN